MLPSMPILFTRESQDAFGNKIVPSTSFFSQSSIPNSDNKPAVHPETSQEAPKQDETKIEKEPELKKKNDPPNIDDDNVLENALVRSYYTRVQSRFSSNPSVPTNKFVQFRNILRDFNPNEETPIDLYKKIEELFGVEHKDIVEDFLLFLKPGQAAKVGRFMDRFMLVQMNGFINMLHITFSRKPTVLRKVLRAITTGINSGNSDDMKSRVLPHLRSNPRLAQVFKLLFPDERPPDSFYESGVDTINESFLTNDRGCDMWEFEDDTEKKRNLETKEGLDTLYLNSRVFLQHGRLLRSARVTYPYSKEPYRVHARRLAPAHSHLSPPDSDDDTPKSPKKLTAKRSRKQTKSPTKKDVNDNTKKDCQILSPKPKKSQKIKNGKKEPECKSEQKRERKDSKVTLHKKESIEPPKPKQAKIEASVSVQANKINPIDIKSNNDVKGNSWTRDEDKTMLQVLKGEAGSETVFGRISELLPHRSATEIKERFCHVMTLLQQMAVGEVT